MAKSKISPVWSWSSSRTDLPLKALLFGVVAKQVLVSTGDVGCFMCSKLMSNMLFTHHHCKAQLLGFECVCDILFLCVSYMWINLLCLSLSVYLSVCLCVCLCVCLSVYLSIDQHLQRDGTRIMGARGYSICYLSGEETKNWGGGRVGGTNKKQLAICNDLFVQRCHRQIHARQIQHSKRIQILI